MRYLKDLEKVHTRNLYEKCFNDSSKFTDYYYNKCLENTKVLVEEDDDIISMLQIKDKKIVCEGELRSSAYIYGVCTDERYRGKGIVKSLLVKALKDIKNDGYDFAYLIPANPDIYRGVGFVMQNESAFHKKQELFLSQKGTGMNKYNMMSEFYLYVLKKKADVYIFKDEKYLKQQEEIFRSDAGNMYFDNDIYYANYENDIQEYVSERKCYCKNKIMYRAFNKSVENVLGQRVFITDEV